MLYYKTNIPWTIIDVEAELFTQLATVENLFPFKLFNVNSFMFFIKIVSMVFHDSSSMLHWNSVYSVPSTNSSSIVLQIHIIYFTCPIHNCLL